MGCPSPLRMRVALLLGLVKYKVLLTFDMFSEPVLPAALAIVNVMGRVLETNMNIRLNVLPPLDSQ